ncbi:uncharacterized protein LOC106870885 [Octopus bimaculoides]|uniref:uncharacterized protein LOC106870885 n=1 Tax=Octopus bimaculoides TaxID=37653 RepID=UPI00071E3D96|nr:uncharacterized protein LOC106870885 [Octopus bimaculoides]|eukprot:XP_014772607.1 PREDICTED: uncharacterized protein LOC106870885 [Octopus bimaculoides]
MFHFLKSKNLLFSIEEVMQMTANCNVCCELKSFSYQHSDSHLIKATQPFERLSVDFKRPLPSNSLNKNLLTAIDEYLHFPFAFPCPEEGFNYQKCFCKLFSLFGMPSYVHSERRTSFMFYVVRELLRVELWHLTPDEMIRLNASMELYGKL